MFYNQSSRRNHGCDLLRLWDVVDSSFLYDGVAVVTGDDMSQVNDRYTTYLVRIPDSNAFRVALFSGIVIYNEAQVIERAVMITAYYGPWMEHNLNAVDIADIFYPRLHLLVPPHGMTWRDISISRIVQESDWA